MRQKRFSFHTAHQAAIVCLLLVWVLSPLRASASPTLTLSRGDGPPRTKLLVSGSGFQGNLGVNIFFDNEAEAQVNANPDGTFQNVEITVPALATPGKHWITALEHRQGENAQKAFSVHTDWLQSDFGQSGGRLNPYENVLNPANVGAMHLKWSFPTQSFMWSSPALANGVLYVGSDQLYAIDVKSGATLWTYPTGGSFSSPAVGNGAVYIGTYSGDFLALNAKTGVELWQYSAGSQVASPPTLANGMIYFGTDDGNFRALSASTGAPQWIYKTNGYARSAPTVSNGIVYAGSDDGNLSALDATTGSEVWKFKTDGEIYISSPAVNDGLVYVASCGAGHTVYALNAATGALVWKYLVGDGTQASIGLAPGVVYVASADGSLYALDANNGTKLWSYAGGFYSSSPAIANGIVYIGSSSGTLFALNARNGNVQWSYPAGTAFEYASPIVADGVLYTGSDSGTVYAFGMPNK